jgi:uncharacterized protein YjaZ
MSVFLHTLKASKRLGPFETLITSGFTEGLEQVEGKISLPDVDVVIADNPSAVIPETGVGGSAPNAHLLYISIDPEFLNLKDTLEYEIRSTLAHELHHTARWKAVGYGKTLLEAIVSEGLADHFDLEINGGAPKPWSISVEGEKLRELQERAQIEFNNDQYDHRAWFFGSEKETIPRWSGYSLGFEIVRKYMEKSGKSAAELTGTEAKNFVTE